MGTNKPHVHVKYGLKSDLEDYAKVNQDLVQCATLGPGRVKVKRCDKEFIKYIQFCFIVHCAVCLRGVYKVQEGAEI